MEMCKFSFFCQYIINSFQGEFVDNTANGFGIFSNSRKEVRGKYNISNIDL